MDISIHDSAKDIIHNKDISFMNIYAPNKTSTTFVKQKLQEMTLIMEESNKTLLVQKRSSGQKISRERGELNSIIRWILSIHSELYLNNKYIFC